MSRFVIEDSRNCVPLSPHGTDVEKSLGDVQVSCDQPIYINPETTIGEGGTPSYSSRISEFEADFSDVFDNDKSTLEGTHHLFIITCAVLL
jgi:hypothetical protein